MSAKVRRKRRREAVRKREQSEVTRTMERLYPEPRPPAHVLEAWLPAGSDADSAVFFGVDRSLVSYRLAERPVTRWQRLRRRLAVPFEWAAYVLLVGASFIAGEEL